MKKRGRHRKNKLIAISSLCVVGGLVAIIGVSALNMYMAAVSSSYIYTVGWDDTDKYVSNDLLSTDCGDCYLASGARVEDNESGDVTWNGDEEAHNSVAQDTNNIKVSDVKIERGFLGLTSSEAIENAQIIYNLLHEAGFSTASTAGIMGNIMQESSYLLKWGGSNRKGTWDEQKSTYFGFVQASKTQIRNYWLPWMTQQGLNIDTTEGYMKGFIYVFTEGSEKNCTKTYAKSEYKITTEEFKQLTDPILACDYFIACYERCINGTSYLTHKIKDGKYQQATEREQMTQQCYDYLLSHQVGSSTSNSQVNNNTENSTENGTNNSSGNSSSESSSSESTSSNVSVSNLSLSETVGLPQGLYCDSSGRQLSPAEVESLFKQTAPNMYSKMIDGIGVKVTEPYNETPDRFKTMFNASEGLINYQQWGSIQGQNKLGGWQFSTKYLKWIRGTDGNGGDYATIHQAGCGFTALSIISSTLLHRYISPAEILMAGYMSPQLNNDASTNNLSIYAPGRHVLDYSHAATILDTFRYKGEKLFNVRVSYNISKADVDATLDAGGLVELSTHKTWTKNGHFIAIREKVVGTDGSVKYYTADGSHNEIAGSATPNGRPNIAHPWEDIANCIPNQVIYVTTTNAYQNYLNDMGNGVVIPQNGNNSSSNDPDVHTMTSASGDVWNCHYNCNHVASCECPCCREYFGLEYVSKDNGEKEEKEGGILSGIINAISNLFSFDNGVTYSGTKHSEMNLDTGEGKYYTIEDGRFTFTGNSWQSSAFLGAAREVMQGVINAGTEYSQTDGSIRLTLPDGSTTVMPHKDCSGYVSAVLSRVYGETVDISSQDSLRTWCDEVAYADLSPGDIVSVFPDSGGNGHIYVCAGRINDTVVAAYDWGSTHTDARTHGNGYCEPMQVSINPDTYGRMVNKVWRPRVHAFEMYGKTYGE